MMKIMTIVGTRPELIKLSLVIKELDKHTDHTLVHTGQNYDYELNNIFFDEMGIREPNFYLDISTTNTAKAIGDIIFKSDEIMNKVNPDAVLIYGDTNSALSVISAKRRKIPVFHMEAGNRCFDERVPEELNRKIVDTISDINLTLTEHARRYLLNEGKRPETVIKVGSSMKEVLNFYQKSINKSTILKKHKLKNNNYFLVSIHREENLDNEINFNDLLSSLNDIASIFKKEILISTHPRTQKKINSLKNISFDPLIHFIKPLGFFDYINLQKNSLCTISDSGTITEESSILGFKAITIRQAHERPEGMDEGTLIMTGLKSKNIINALNILIEQKNEKIKIVEDYDVDNVSVKVLRIILSYTEYINNTVWKKL
ncbi:MAG: UDP-N-acetylglucosamine 2-epimerase (non-hydrolyzing) [Flavobacteriales bacterium]|nr:UDP-N-acetylglucosamine 2-epimerase (non-hydrolyzing) [Flavobacteriales bacterium]